MNGRKFIAHVNDSISNYDFKEAFEVISQHARDLADIIHLENVYAVLLAYARYIMKRSETEFPHQPDRDRFVIAEFVDLLKTFQLSKKESEKFMTDVTVHFPSALKTKIAKRLQ